MDVIAYMKAIRDNASANYQARVPAATRTNLESVGQVITSYGGTANEFLTTLIDRIVKVIIDNKSYKNPLAILKKGGNPLGKDIQNIFVNPVAAEHYDYKSTDLLTNKPPDVKAIYYRLNRQDKYPVTISRVELRKVFTTEQTLATFIQNIINSLYSSDQIDEFILMKNLFATAVEKKHIHTLEIYDENTNAKGIDDVDVSKLLVKMIKRYSKKMTFPSSDYNMYKEIVAKDNDDVKPVTTFTEKKDQVLILNADVSANLDVDVLAYAFNLEKSQVKVQTLDVDDFGDQPVLAILCDKAFVQVYDNAKETASFNNGDTLTLKYFLHHWQTYAYSIFANAIAFTYKVKA